MHNKLLIVDGELVSVGSTNFDPRSFRLNDEASLNVYDRGFAADMTAVFDADLRQRGATRWRTGAVAPGKSACSRSSCYRSNRSSSRAQLQSRAAPNECG